MRNVRLKIQKLLDRLRTAGFHDQRAHAFFALQDFWLEFDADNVC